jgi:hypothetical protein
MGYQIVLSEIYIVILPNFRLYSQHHDVISFFRHALFDASFGGLLAAERGAARQAQHSADCRR